MASWGDFYKKGGMPTVTKKVVEQYVAPKAPAPPAPPAPSAPAPFYAGGGMPTITTPTITPPPTPAIVQATGGYVPAVPATPQTVLATSGYGQPITAPTLANYIQQNIGNMEAIRAASYGWSPERIESVRSVLYPQTHEERMLAAKVTLQSEDVLRQRYGSFAGIGEVRSVTRGIEDIGPAPGPMDTAAIVAWAARYTGEAIFNYAERPNFISTTVASELPYKYYGYDTVEEFLTDIGYEYSGGGRWDRLDPIAAPTTGGYGGYGGGGGGYYPYSVGRGAGGGQGGGLIMWRIGL